MKQAWIGAALLVAACSQPEPTGPPTTPQDQRLARLVLAEFMASQCGPAHGRSCESVRVNCVRPLPLSGSEKAGGVSRKLVLGATYVVRPAGSAPAEWRTGGFLKEYALIHGRWAQSGASTAAPEAFAINCIGSADQHGRPIPLE
jgi:hypothetical protein